VDIGEADDRGQHQTRGVDREQVHTMPDKTVQQLDHVVPVGQGTGQLHKSLGQLGRCERGVAGDGGDQ
jgi:hypothetical protein